MTAISNVPTDLHGKETFVRQAEINIDLKFGLWQDYSQWLDPALHLDYWHDLSCLSESDVCVEIDLGSETVYRHNFKIFETVKISHVFEDMSPGNYDLAVRIINLNNLPIRDDTGKFVSAMLEIQSLRIQHIEILHMLENTLFGKDSSVSLSISKPIYSWMIENWATILPKFLDFPITGIETINS